MTWHLGVLVSHPIQYLAPWFRHLSTRLDLEVFYAHRQDSRGQGQAGFDVEFEWDTPLLDGYQNRFLTNVARRPSVSTFRGCDTPEIYDVIRPGSFDAFLVFGWNRKSSLQAIRACRQTKTPVLMRGDSQLATRRSLVKSAIKYFPYRWFLPRLDAHLYVGQRNRAYLKHYGVPDARLFFVPHFVDNEFFAEGARKAEEEGKHLELRARLGIPDDAFVFLFVGKMTPKKRPADFVRACMRVLNSAEGSNVHALLVGDGPLRAELEQLAKPRAERFHFTGFLNQSQMPVAYKVSNALVLPSDGDETWGLVVNEAAACGVPAVVSDMVGCVPEMILDRITGYSYPAGDVDSLVRCLTVLKSECASNHDAMAEGLAVRVESHCLEAASLELYTALEAATTKKPQLLTVRTGQL